MGVEITTRYCPICGKAVSEATYNRFGEWACSEAHAEEYVAEVRAQKQRQLVKTAGGPAPAPERRRGGCC